MTESTTQPNFAVARICPMCDEVHAVMVHAADYHRWTSGTLIQVAFPYLNADDRELLMTGICGACYAMLEPAAER